MLDIFQEHLIEFICTGLMSGTAAVVLWAIRRLKSFFVVVRADSRDKIIRFAKFYILTNEITYEELESLTDIYKGYAELGGNGVAKEFYERCLELPMVSERTKWNPYYVGKDGYIGGHRN